MLDDDGPDLAHLIGFRLGPVALQVDALGDAGLAEHVVIPTDPPREAQMGKQADQVVERDLCVRDTPQDPVDELVLACDRDSRRSLHRVMALRQSDSSSVNQTSG